MTNQGDRHKGFRSIAGTSSDFSGDSIAAFKAQGATQDNYNGAFIEWLQIRTGLTNGNLNGLQAAFAEQYGFNQWDGVNQVSNTVRIQPFVINIAGGVASGTATIETVDLSRSCIICNGYTVSDNTSVRSVYPKLILTNSTTVTATRISTSKDLTVHGYVVEYSELLVDNVQRISITVSGSSNTGTIDSVDTARSIVFVTSHTASASQIDRSNLRVILTDSTTVTAERGDGSGIGEVDVAVIQFKSGVVKSIQNEQLEIAAGGGTSSSNTITAVDTSNTVLYPRGIFLTQSRTFDEVMPLVYLQDATTVTMETRVGSAVAASQINVAVVEFNDLIIRNIIRNRLQITGTQTQGTDTIAAVNTNKAYVTYLDFKTSATGGTESQAFASVDLTNSTTVTATRGEPASGTVTTSYEIVEFY